jgi:hypothetical protein
LVFVVVLGLGGVGGRGGQEMTVGVRVGTARSATTPK